MRYAQVIYLTAPAAGPVVTRAAAALRQDDQARVTVRELPRPRWARSWPGERLVVAEADRLPVAAPQSGQGHRLAAGVRGRDRGLAADPGHGRRVRAGLAARAGRRPGCAARPAGRCSCPLAWLAAAALHPHRLRAAALVPVRAWEHGWPYPAACWPRPGSSLLFIPVTVPAGLALAAGVWAWRNYAITTGLAGITASAPITFDTRQWKRQVRTAKGLIDAPGAVPLLGRGGKIPVGGTIRAIGHHWDPVFTLPPTACARHMVIVGATGSGKTNLMIRLWAGWFTATLDALWPERATAPQLIVLDCKGGQRRPPQSRPHQPAALRRRRPPRRHLARRSPPVPVGPARPATWPSCFTR